MEGGEVGRKIVAGAVFVPMRGEMFSAFAGGGAWLAGRRAASPLRLRCGPGVPLRQALVGTGFGYLPARRQVQGEVVAALLPRMRDIRRIGVASVDLCAVAAGRLDGFYERGLNYWDWAAGALVATEAGAVVGGLHGAPAVQLDDGGRRARPVRPAHATRWRRWTPSATPDAAARRVKPATPVRTVQRCGRVGHALVADALGNRRPARVARASGAVISVS